MRITIATTTFEHATYDREVDVLYLDISDPPVQATRTVTMPGGGGNVRYGDNGEIVGMTILHARRRLERDGELVLKLPDEHVSADQLQPALA